MKAWFYYLRYKIASAIFDFLSARMPEWLSAYIDETIKDGLDDFCRESEDNL